MEYSLQALWLCAVVRHLLVGFLQDCAVEAHYESLDARACPVGSWAMMNQLHSVYALALIASLSCPHCSDDNASTDAASDAAALDAAQDRSHDASAEDAMSDAVDAADPECANLQSRWLDLVQGHLACQSNADCDKLETFNSCDCNPGVQVVFAKAARAQIVSFLQRGVACSGSWPGEICDAAPLRDVRCVDQQCRADYPSCFELDGGSEDAGR